MSPEDKRSVGLPTERDINRDDCLDGRVARDHFLGKTVEEAELLFRENSFYYQEDLLFMGPVAFRYYLPAVVAYLRSDHSADDDLIVSGLYGLIESRLDHEGRSIVTDHVHELVDYVIANFDKFGDFVDPEFLADYRRLKTRLTDMA